MQIAPYFGFENAMSPAQCFREIPFGNLSGTVYDMHTIPDIANSQTMTTEETNLAPDCDFYPDLFI